MYDLDNVDNSGQTPKQPGHLRTDIIDIFVYNVSVSFVQPPRLMLPML